MKGPDVVPFRAPAALAVEIELPHRGRVRGMGMRHGVSLIVGGGFHGKTTLLKAVEAGVYDKVRPSCGAHVLKRSLLCMRIQTWLLFNLAMSAIR